jgi:hypothetical protein
MAAIARKKLKIPMVTQVTLPGSNPTIALLNAGIRGAGAIIDMDVVAVTIIIVIKRNHRKLE